MNHDDEQTKEASLAAMLIGLAYKPVVGVGLQNAVDFIQNVVDYPIIMRNVINGK